MSAIAHSCASCGSDLPAGARFCAACGARTRASGAGAVSWSTAERRYFGALPAKRWIGTARGRLGRWVAVARSNVRLVAAVLRSQVRAALEGYRLRREGTRLVRERRREMQALGEAVYRDQSEDATDIRARIAALERRMEAVHEAIAEVERRTDEQIARAQIEGGPTNVVEPNPAPSPSPPGEPEPPIKPEPEPVPSDPPGPVIIPEPEPVPSDPPGPVIVPEPEPVPHEPPGPVIVPEPEPPAGR
jgi:hypothetical protein